MNQNYLLLGPEEGEKTLFIEEKIASIKKQIGNEPEISRFYAFESQMIDIVALLQNGSLFTGYKVVILNEADLIKKQNEISILADYLKKPAQNATLFLLSKTISGVKQGVSRAIQNRIKKKNMKIFWEMFENRKVDWITTFFHKRGIRIDREASEFLLEMIENNTKDLEQECGKLACFFGKDSKLETETIEKYIYHSKEENTFTLFEKIASRDFGASEDALENILLSKESDSVTLLGGLLWQIRNLIKLKQLLANNFSSEEAFSRLKISSKKSRRILMNAHSRYSQKEARRLVMLIAEFEMRLRSVSGEMTRLLLGLFIYYAVVRGGRVPRLSSY